MDSRKTQPTPAEKWDKLYADGAAYKPLNLLLLRKILKRMKELTGTDPTNALDLGCGTGEALAKLKVAGIEDVTGIDCSRVALDEAKRQLPDGVLHCCDLSDAELPTNRQFDLILCKLTLAFVRDREKFLQKVSGLMHEKSALCVITPVLHESIDYTKADKPGIAVKYGGFKELLGATFGHVEELYHDHTGERGDVVTFLATK